MSAENHTATAIPLIYSFSGNSAASAPISTFMCLWAIYIDPGAVFTFPPAEKADPSWEYIIPSQTHECGNWDWGPVIPFLGIFVSNFRHFVFAVQTKSRVWEDSSLCPETLTKTVVQGFHLRRGESDPWKNSLVNSLLCGTPGQDVPEEGVKDWSCERTELGPMSDGMPTPRYTGQDVPEEGVKDWSCERTELGPMSGGMPTPRYMAWLSWVADSYRPKSISTPFTVQNNISLCTQFQI